MKEEIPPYIHVEVMPTEGETALTRNTDRKRIVPVTEVDDLPVRDP